MPKKSANYPDWVMKFKKKGTYINKVGDKYYLYAAHSERVKGTNKVKRVSDGYLGRITEADGLIPAKSQLRTPPVCYELGLSYAIIYLTSDILSGLVTSFPKYGKAVYSCSVLLFIYGIYNRFLFEHSFVSLFFSDAAYPDRFSPAQITGIERGCRMINDRLNSILGDDLNTILSLFTDVRLIKAAGKYFLSELSEDVLALSQKYSIDWSNELWQK